LAKSLSPRESLRSTHEKRMVVRSVVGSWLGGLKKAERDRFVEYVDAYVDLPEVSLPDLSSAVSSDEKLGPIYPKISNESLGKWIRTVYVKEEES
jgi:hypothetical protein